MFVRFQEWMCSTDALAYVWRTLRSDYSLSVEWMIVLYVVELRWSEQMCDTYSWERKNDRTNEQTNERKNGWWLDTRRMCEQPLMPLALSLSLCSLSCTHASIWKSIDTKQLSLHSRLTAYLDVSVSFDDERTSERTNECTNECNRQWHLNTCVYSR